MSKTNIATTMTKRTPAIPVDFKRNAWDRQVEMLAREGLYATTIAAAGLLTVHQVRYRMREAGFSRAYRQGKDDKGRRTIARIDKLLRQCRHLRQEIGRETRGKR